MRLLIPRHISIDNQTFAIVRAWAYKIGANAATPAAMKPMTKEVELSNNEKERGNIVSIHWEFAVCLYARHTEVRSTRRSEQTLTLILNTRSVNGVVSRCGNVIYNRWQN